MMCFKLDGEVRENPLPFFLAFENFPTLFFIVPMLMAKSLSVASFEFCHILSRIKVSTYSRATEWSNSPHKPLPASHMSFKAEMTSGVYCLGLPLVSSLLESLSRNTPNLLMTDFLCIFVVSQTLLKISLFLRLSAFRYSLKNLLNISFFVAIVMKTTVTHLLSIHYALGSIYF